MIKFPLLKDLFQEDPFSTHFHNIVQIQVLLWAQNYQSPLIQVLVHKQPSLIHILSTVPQDFIHLCTKIQDLIQEMEGSPLKLQSLNIKD